MVYGFINIPVGFTSTWLQPIKPQLPWSPVTDLPCLIQLRAPFRHSQKSSGLWPPKICWISSTFPDFCSHVFFLLSFVVLLQKKINCDWKKEFQNGSTPVVSFAWLGNSCFFRLLRLFRKVVPWRNGHRCKKVVFSPSSWRDDTSQIWWYVSTRF